MGLSSRTVSNYCKNNRIHRRFKNGKLGWYIHIDETKPLTDAEIHLLLALSIQLKNKPSLTIDWTTFNFDDDAIDAIYQSLYLLGYIHPYSVSYRRRIPYEVILTQKGLEMATAFNKKSFPDFSTVCSQWLSVLINAVQLYIQIKQAS